MNFAIVYDSTTGAIKSTVSSVFSENIDAHENDGNSVLRTAYVDVNVMSQYVGDGELKNCVVPTNVVLSSTVAAVGEDVTISGIPSDAFLHSTQTEDLVAVTDGSYTFTSTETGSIALTFMGKYEGEYVIMFDSLAASKAKAQIAVDTDAEASRARVVTPGSGQAMTYLRKADAAIAFLAGATLSAPQTQRLSDEAARLGVTVEVAAQGLADTAMMWEMLDAAIDNLRLTAKQEIAAATTGAEIEAILNAINWPV